MIIYGNKKKKEKEIRANISTQVHSFKALYT